MHFRNEACFNGKSILPRGQSRLSYSEAVLLEWVCPASSRGLSVFPFRIKALLLLVVILFCAIGNPAQTEPKPTRLLFTGDILLSRRVASELERSKVSPWARFAELFQSAQWVSGNL